MRDYCAHTSFRESIAGNELSNSVSSSFPPEYPPFPPPPPSKSSSSSSTKAALSLLVLNWLASSPKRAFSRERKSSPPEVGPKEASPCPGVCAATGRSVSTCTGYFMRHQTRGGTYSQSQTLQETGIGLPC